MTNIAVLDYGLGNVRSVRNALQAVGANAIVTREPEQIQESDGLIIPGVGSFPHGMECLNKYKLTPILHKYFSSDRPVLGICLGMQLLFDKGLEFSSTNGLGTIPGVVDRIPISQEEGRLPHISWSTIKKTRLGKDTIFFDLKDSELRFYFVHSYAAVGVDKTNISATVNYLGKEIVAAVQHNNIWGTQFHPEKSGPSGLHLLSNFVARCQ